MAASVCSEELVSMLFRRWLAVEKAVAVYHLVYCVLDKISRDLRYLVSCSLTCHSEQIQAKYLKGKTVIGVAAGRFHTVLWTREAVYTLGLNGGQLGKKSFMAVSENCRVILGYVFYGLLICVNF